MRGKIFTPDEANRMLPLVSRIADDIVGTYAEVNAALQAFEACKAAIEKTAEKGAEQSPAQESELRQRDAQVANVLDRFQGLIEEIEGLGGTVKDYERGFVDFY